MGIVRSTPDNEVHSNCQSLKDLNLVQASVCGWQHYMQDYTGHAVINSQLSVYFVIDGHGGPEIAQLASLKIPEILKKNQLITLKQYKAALENLFQTLDISLRKQAAKCSQIRQKYGIPALVSSQPSGGCSIVIVLLSEDQMVIGNIGECKAYVCYRKNLSKAVLISGNHTESNAQDQKRVKNAGGFFLNGKVNGMMPFTRSIGDYAFKNNQFLLPNQQLLISSASIFALRKQDIKVVVMGSSGVWEKPNKVLKQLTEEDFQLQQLKLKSKQLLQGLVSQNCRQNGEGLKNMALMVLDLKI